MFYYANVERWEVPADKKLEYILECAARAGRMHFTMPEKDTQFWDHLVESLLLEAERCDIDYSQALEFCIRIAIWEAADNEWELWGAMLDLPEEPEHELMFA